MNDLSHLFDGLFYDFEKPEPIAQSEIDTAQKRLGVRLPADYIELLKHQNGGMVRRWISDPACPLGMVQISGLGGEHGIDSLTGGVTLNQNLIANWNYPPRSVIFCHQGPSGFGFDYADTNEAGEPTVFCMDNDRAVPILYPRVFRSFRQLLESLTRLPNEV